MLRQRKQPGALFDESVADDAFFEVGWHEACSLTALEPVGELRIEVVDRSECARREEGFAQVANTPLHASLLVAARDGAGLRRKVVMACELEDARMKSR